MREKEYNLARLRIVKQLSGIWLKLHAGCKYEAAYKVRRIWMYAAGALKGRSVLSTRLCIERQGKYFGLPVLAPRERAA